jgi:hypothetical protein
MLRLACTGFNCYTLYLDHFTPRYPAIHPVLCLLRNLTPELFPLRDIKVYVASEPLLNSCFSWISENSNLSEFSSI